MPARTAAHAAPCDAQARRVLHRARRHADRRKYTLCDALCARVLALPCSNGASEAKWGKERLCASVQVCKCVSVCMCA